MEGTLADEHAPFITHEKATQKSFQNDPAFAAEYLNAVLEDGEEAELFLALRRGGASGRREISAGIFLFQESGVGYNGRVTKEESLAITTPYDHDTE